MERITIKMVMLFKMIEIWLLLVDVEYQNQKKVVPKSPGVVKRRRNNMSYKDQLYEDFEMFDENSTECVECVTFAFKYCSCGEQDNCSVFKEYHSIRPGRWDKRQLWLKEWYSKYIKSQRRKKLECIRRLNETKPE